MLQNNQDFQSIIMALQQYWVDWGCTLWQPYNNQVGAGTMNPATFLRVLGPEPWNVAYVEPSVRPDDGRYGENPNRLQQHYQFQVILKPDPGDPQEVYLRSLEAIGIDIAKHDIRFVEDNWASPALGAWGLGWEVWLDGLEITQFTYFQQAGGQKLDPVSIEITYGLDRIAMALQGVANIADVQWSSNRTWGDLNLQGEREHSRYYFELADLDRLRKMFELYEGEAQAALEAGLVLPAHDYVLKCSHTFNILDTRGAIGVTERQGYFRRIRKLSAQVAEAYVEDRQRQEYPWGDSSTSASGAAKSSPAEKAPAISSPSKAADFLLEIGTEELPPADLDSSMQQLELFLQSLFLDVYPLKNSGIKIFGTPRRIVALIQDLAPGTPEITREVKGPPTKAAYDSAGLPTKALKGWAARKNLTLENIQRKETDGGEYVFGVETIASTSSVELLSKLVPSFLGDIKFPKSMRWNDDKLTFSRPIRWILAMHGSHLIPFDYAGLSSAKASRGLRNSPNNHFEIESLAQYFSTLNKEKILVSEEERRGAILAQVEKLAKEKAASVPEDPDLLDEVVRLVEAPQAMLGEFEAKYLTLPREVLIAVMKKHQRYFPLEKNGKLINAFVALGNGQFDVLAVTAGNVDVIHARFSDAAYFVDRDQQRPFEDFADDLKQLTFQSDLGTMWDKSQRLVKLVEALSPQLNLTKAEQKSTSRAAALAKADLATQMVVDMTSLQGIMGKYYALNSGETSEVAQAILEHYLPRFAKDTIPQSKAGLALSIVDRLDTLTGLFAVGLAPTGTKDPFAMRRSAIGLVQTLIASEQDFDLRAAIASAAKMQPLSVSQASQEQCFEFILRRMRTQMLDEGYRHDMVDAILAAQAANPSRAHAAVVELSKHQSHKIWPDLLDTFARCVRITRDLDDRYAVNEKLLEQKEERELYKALQEAEKVERPAGDVLAFLKSFLPMMPAIKSFFDKVLVNAEDEKLRQNRLALLQRIAARAEGVADFSKLEGF